MTLSEIRILAADLQSLARQLGNLQSRDAVIPRRFAARAWIALLKAGGLNGYPVPGTRDDCLIWAERMRQTAYPAPWRYVGRAVVWAVRRALGMPATMQATMDPADVTALINTLLNAGNYLDATTRPSPQPAGEE